MRYWVSAYQRNFQIRATAGSPIGQLWDLRTVVFDSPTEHHLEYRGPTVWLINLLEQACKERGLTLSRWETHSKGSQYYRSTVTWAAHYGDRPMRSTDLAKSGDPFYTVILDRREGKTERCPAYAALYGLLETIQAIPTI